MTPILAPVSLGCWHFLFKYLVSKIDFEAQDHLGLPIWDMAFMQSRLFQPGAPVLLTHLLLSLHCHYTDSHLFKLPQYQASRKWTEVLSGRKKWKLHSISFHGKKLEPVMYSIIFLIEGFHMKYQWPFILPPNMSSLWPSSENSQILSYVLVSVWIKLKTQGQGNCLRRSGNRTLSLDESCAQVVSFRKWLSRWSLEYQERRSTPHPCSRAIGAWSL